MLRSMGAGVGNKVYIYISVLHLVNGILQGWSYINTLSNSMISLEGRVVACILDNNQR